MTAGDDFTFDVFLSHHSKDKPEVRRLAERLREGGLRVWFDDWVIKPGDDIYLVVERGLMASRALILCMSPAAFSSEWVSLERSTVLFRDPNNKSRRFIPLLLADCEIPDTLRRYKYVDLRRQSEAAYNELLAACRPGGAPPAAAAAEPPPKRRPKIYLYVSAPKVEMLHSQTPAAISRPAISDGGGDGQETLYGKLAQLQKQLEEEDSVQDIADVRPGDCSQFLKGSGVWNASLIRKAYPETNVGDTEPLAYCLYKQFEEVCYFLLGSPSNITGNTRLAGHTTKVSPSWTVDEYIMGLIRQRMREPFDESAWLGGLLGYCAQICRYLPRINAEVLFLAYSSHEVSSNEWEKTVNHYTECASMYKPSLVVVGSPIYVALNPLR